VALLCERDTGAAVLAARLAVPVRTVTRHLAALEARRLIRVVNEDGERRYRVVEPVLHGLVACMEDCSR
jgi:DNA-binding MarR family transcriptional regulator